MRSIPASAVLKSDNTVKHTGNMPTHVSLPMMLWLFFVSGLATDEAEIESYDELCTRRYVCSSIASDLLPFVIRKFQYCA